MAFALSFRIAAWAGWRPGDEESPTRRGAEPSRPLPAMLRRRVTDIGRQALEAAWAVLPDGMTPRLVLSSRHGEYDRTLGLLRSLAEDGTTSPAEFSMAVHHALAGLLSIATGNRAGHTAVAAGPESLGYGVLEAAAALAEDRAPVLLFHFDPRMPGHYAPVCDGADDEGALAMLLAPASEDRGEHIRLSVETASPGSSRPPPMTAALLDFLRSGKAASDIEGQTMIWRWRRAP